ncbi:hypothetical protein JW988_08670 [Candidatus Bathyarchaeota archaeon]|nr:hypothetical protein [Candidatus Bathyarchaeota archaeon]
MKKSAIAAISLMLLCLTVVIRQIACYANANPNWRPWENALGQPIITVFSPVENQSCFSSEITLNFTVAKPADWLDSNVQMKYVAYCVDGFVDGVSDENETIVAVQEPMDDENPTSFSFSFNLTGLKDGPHWLDIYAEGGVSGLTIGTTKRVNFTTYTPETEAQSESFPASLVTASVIIVAFVSAGLLIYFKKRKN